MTDTVKAIFIILGFALMAAGVFSNVHHVKRKRKTRAAHSVRRAYPGLDKSDPRRFGREVQNLVRRGLK